MSRTKRYYWLKLNESFFEEDTIEWIEEQENGERYVLFYLKLCLKSLKENGNLIRYVGEKVIPYDIKALAKLTNTDTDTVAVALKVFQEIGLVQIRETGEIYMNQINEMIGSETDTAKRVRKHRAKKAMLQCNTPETNGNGHVIKGNTDIDIELDIDKELEIESSSIYKDNKATNDGSSSGSTLKYDDDFGLVIKTFNENIHLATPIEIEKLGYWLDDGMEPNVLIAAIEQAVKYAGRNMGYIETVLTNWSNRGIKSKYDLDAHQRDWEDKRNKGANTSGANNGGSTDASGWTEEYENIRLTF